MPETVALAILRFGSRCNLCVAVFGARNPVQSGQVGARRSPISPVYGWVLSLVSEGGLKVRTFYFFLVRWSVMPWIVNVRELTWAAVFGLALLSLGSPALISRVREVCRPYDCGFFIVVLAPLLLEYAAAVYGWGV